MSRANKNDIDAAIRTDAVALDLFTSCSEFHIREKMGLDPEENINKYLELLDYALDQGACATEAVTGSDFDRWAGYGSGPVIPELNNMPTTIYRDHFQGHAMEINHEKWTFESKEDAAYVVKKAAKKYGASLVGIAPYDERFVYETETFIPIDANTGKIQLDRLDFPFPDFHI